ncbi:MAG TPA: RdgB/HAM1 family non-canonical purine NTP pyrophosphatase [Candidatus Saccharimonadaceae bacterium]|nr:RdgB/HAM1 family non-canonical purine NTP pyrophosphatase [Candidatus Saccharimonadaceae bacterium]
MHYTLATFNRDKLREFKRLFEGSDIELTGIADYPGASVPAETGATLLENAELKAKAAVQVSRFASIADDTGLEIDALHGRPGVRTSRYAGPSARDQDNVEAVLEQMKAVPLEKRTARFRTVLVAAFPRGPEIVAEGVLEGRITLEPRGSNGFGYDPVFELPDLGRTLAELTLEEKNRLSHRGRAVQRLIASLWAR